MTKKEMKIKKDVYNELDIPNVLDRVQPYAENRALELGENNRTIHLDFHRPARLITLSAMFIIVFALTTVFVLNLNKGMRIQQADASNANNKNYEAENGAAHAPEQAVDESYGDFYSEYANKSTADLSNEEVHSIYYEIKGYIDEGKSLDEIYDIYSSQGNEVDKDTIEFIYNYIKNN